MISTDQCLKYAEECERLSEEDTSPEERETLLALAKQWRAIAVLPIDTSTLVH